MLAEKQPIRLLLVDDSMFFLTVMNRALKASADIQVVGIARSAEEAWEQIERLKPDVVTLDIEMPGESGIEFLKRYLKEKSLPFVLVSSLDMRLFDALQVGAVDYVKKPSMTAGETALPVFIKTLETKVRIAKQARVRRKPIVSAGAILTGELKLMKEIHPETLIMIGASTGGTEATTEILTKLPPNMPPILIVQHMPAGFTRMYAERLDKLCRMKVKEAEDHEKVEWGTVYIAPGGPQMTVKRDRGRYRLRCIPGEKRSGHSPSVDTLFESGAEAAGRKAVGIILTGMGRDGAAGLLTLKQRGGYTIGQDESSSVVYGMPGEAKKLGAVMLEAPCGEIASRLIDHLNR